MQLAEIIKWYSDFTDTKLNAGVVFHMKKVGMIGEDMNLDTINSFMLLSENGEYIKNDVGRYVVKDSRKALNGTFEQGKTQPQKPQQQRKPLRFKIEKTGDRKLKLIKN